MAGHGRSRRNRPLFQSAAGGIPMNKAEGARLARLAAESYSHQIEAIDQTVHQLDAAVAPLFESFAAEVMALASELIPDLEHKKPISTQAPLLQEWLAILEPYSAAL